MRTPNGLRYSMITIHTLVSRDQIKLQSHPVYGDMLIIEYSIRDAGKHKMRRAFAYVTGVQQQKASRYLMHNTVLSK